jgi:ubiquinone/menaquinone biosynthesis C-methylase UbiE
MSNNIENDPSGDAESFNENWKKRPETHYLHWTRDEPQNQIQLAFRRHWLTFQNLIGDRYGSKRSLEVGCGRGSLSAYFADNQWDCTLLDLSSVAIEQAKKAFFDNNLKANFKVADCLNMPFEDGEFDVVFSIGLLEHFEKLEDVLSEQYRLLADNGIFIGYVVPELLENCQKNYSWINDLLKSLLPEETKNAVTDKVDVYRSDSLSPPYIEIMSRLGMKEIGHSGIYPLPMISHSIEFPFSLLPKQAEVSLVKTFKNWLKLREQDSTDPWLCKEGYGQAFIIWGRK